jgi:long-chain acyl-CoA synthetase
MTLKRLLLDACERRGDAVALRFKKDGQWQTRSYRDVLTGVRHVAERLHELHVRPGDKVALFLPNCPEWAEIYFGIVGLGATAVPVDAKLTEQELSHVLRDSETRLVFATDRAYPLLREVEDHLPAMRTAVLLGRPDVTNRKPAHHVAYENYAASMAATAAKRATPHAFDRHDPAPDDVASILYTSGTTGRQKGAMLTHANFTSNVAACLAAMDLCASDNFLLVLPLHHAFAFTTNLLIPLAAGGEISFVESLKTVGENLREVSPTALIAVPLLTKKLHDRLLAGLRRKPLANLLYRTGLLRGPIVRGVRRALGGRLRYVIVGGAPPDPEVLRGFVRLGVPVLEGYGLTETAPVLTLNPPADPRPGFAGKPLPGVELRIVDPNGDGVGEIAARGPCVMAGYYRNAEATAQAIRDGWFHTGDLGRLTSDGYLQITGRSKNLIVNREGKNIYPEEVEHAIAASPYILESLVLGYRLPGEVGEKVGAIVVPDQQALDELAAREGRTFSESEVRDLMVREVKRTVQAVALYKRPRAIQVRNGEFEKTATAKIKRYLYSLTPATLSST